MKTSTYPVPTAQWIIYINTNPDTIWQRCIRMLKMSALLSKVTRHSVPENFFRFTIYSRVLLIFIQVFFNHLLPDHQSDVFQSPWHHVQVNSSTLDPLVDFFLGGYAHWDGQYFLHISVLGYTHENCLAFFPLFPIVNSVFSFGIRVASFFLISQWNAALLSSIIFNCAIFVVAAWYLFQVTLLLGSDRRFAHQTWLLFCISPATVFFSAPYSESLFCALTLGGLYYCLLGRFFPASLFFSMSAATRSNGLLNIGHLIFFAAVAAWKTKFKNWVKLTTVVLLCVIVTLVPFLGYQYYGYLQFCTDQPPYPLPSNAIRDYLLAKNFTIPGARRPNWCHLILPFSYSSIQSEYWNVGFLRYFEWKQTPNFILALPVIVLISFYVYSYVTRLLFTQSSDKKHPIFRWEAGVFPVHAMFLSIFTLFFAHVQIATRMIASSSPALYWIMAWLSSEPTISQRGQNKYYRPSLTTVGKWMYCYCLSYVVIGTLLFVNNLPWT